MTARERQRERVTARKRETERQREKASGMSRLEAVRLGKQASWRGVSSGMSQGYILAFS